MNTNYKPQVYALATGMSYWVMFFAAVFANFFVVESLLNDPLTTVQQQSDLVRAGIVAFMVTVVCDVVVAWALYALYGHKPLALLSMLFRMMHAAIMGVAIFSLPPVLTATSAEEIVRLVAEFNTIWLIGLFFFGIHLMLLALIMERPMLIALSLGVAGMMYMLDTIAHFVLADYASYQSIFLPLVAVPAILGEMSFAIWLLVKGGVNSNNDSFKKADCV